jgi:hypothetical protein
LRESSYRPRLRARYSKLVARRSCSFRAKGKRANQATSRTGRASSPYSAPDLAGTFPVCLRHDPILAEAGCSIVRDCSRPLGTANVLVCSSATDHTRARTRGKRSRGMKGRRPPFRNRDAESRRAAQASIARKKRCLRYRRPNPLRSPAMHLAPPRQPFLRDHLRRTPRPEHSRMRSLWA